MNQKIKFLKQKLCLMCFYFKNYSDNSNYVIIFYFNLSDEFMFDNLFQNFRLNLELLINLLIISQKF